MKANAGGPIFTTYSKHKQQIIFSQIIGVLLPY